MRKVCIAVNICTYKREESIRHIIEKIRNSLFFQERAASVYAGALYLFITDNAGEMDEIESRHIRLKHNPQGNTGGSGGYQHGIGMIREAGTEFTHVVFMDDDVDFEMSCFYRLYDFLRTVEAEDMDRPVAGRMIRMDNRAVQYTAAEIWNGGHIQHVGFNKDLSEIDSEPWAEYNAGADYGGWWFCCYPWSFVKENDIMPFFLHCDDVEYGLRCRRPPIILKGVQVWHESFEHNSTPLICYYDTRNTLYVNEKYRLQPDAHKVLADWKAKISAYHLHREWDYEYYAIRGMYDFLKGVRWLYRIHPGKYHQRLQRAWVCRYKNSILWRVTESRFKRKYKIESGQISRRQRG